MSVKKGLSETQSEVKYNFEMLSQVNGKTVMLTASLRRDK